MAPSKAASAASASWLPMLIIALAQIQMAFNVNALPVSIGGIVEDLDAAPSEVGSALVFYSLAVAGFVMLGAKLGKRFGARLVFQIGVILHGLAMGVVALSTSTLMMSQVQALAGLAAAGLVPTLVVLIASNYKGKQQSQALGLLGASQASAGILAFLIAGIVGAAVGWRIPFGMLVFLACAIFLLSFRLQPVAPQPGVEIDWIGALLAATAITMISLGFNNLTYWGMVMATARAPFDILGVSPAPLLVILGAMFGQAFFVWSRQREGARKAPLLALEVLDSHEERSATFALFIVSALGPAVNFLIPLYIQIVQGRDSLETAVSVIPYSVAIFLGTALIVQLFDRFTPRRIGVIGFTVVAVGLTLLAFTISNDWGTPAVIGSLIVLGLGEGSLLTLVFNVLVSASPKELSGDVGALRGTTNNLSTAVGTALASALAIGVLSFLISSSLADNPTIPPALLQQVNLDNVEFVSNDQLAEVLSETTATREQVAEAVRINTDERLRALKAAFLVLAGVSLLAIIPATGLPGYLPGEIPAEAAEPVSGRREAPVPSA